MSCCCGAAHTYSLPLPTKGLQAGKGRGMLVPWAAWGAESISHAMIGNILLPWLGFSRREKGEESNAQGGKDQDRAGGSGKEEERGDGALCPHRAAPGHWQRFGTAPGVADAPAGRWCSWEESFPSTGKMSGSCSRAATSTFVTQLLQQWHRGGRIPRVRWEERPSRGKIPAVGASLSFSSSTSWVPCAEG